MENPFFNFDEEMPEEFYSERTQQAFESCSVCDEALENKLHFVEKAYQQNPETQKHFVLFEYAICESCKRNMMRKISQESMQNIQQFMLQMQSDNEFMITEEITVDLTQCSFTQKPVSELEEYHLVGVFKNGKLQWQPFLFGTEMMEAYAEILSQKTKEAFDDFYNDFVDIPPALAKILDKDFSPVIF